MAILTVTEGERVNQTLIDGQIVMSMQMPPVAEKNIAITGASVTMATPFEKATRYIRINCDIACCIAITKPIDNNPAADPVAQVNLHRLGPNETGYYGVDPQGKIAVIASPT